MVCSNCGVVVDNPSIMGRDIIGRSQPGQDVHYPYSQEIQQTPTQQYTTSMNGQTQKLGFDWGSFVGGMIVGGILVALFATATGRSVLGAAGQRTASAIRGR